MKDVTIYTWKDGRTRAYVKGSKKVVSYPRLLIEEKLGRSLSPEEQVHHIDGDPLNNDIDNLTVIPLGEHQRQHNPVKYFDTTVKCAWCGKEFLWTALQQRSHYGNHNKHGSSEPFCSKSCCGQYGTYIQKQQAGVAK